ncbi:hypothetical protein DY000_02055751 [Brassica cretica]|uniref:Uncharacterized protein n=1 Tax=Brassica cretica TaxID=69181 RepID=A0ABQ7A7X5_BRACR|nr:hypothetical protein DY000_02055751 [Brassica cretica]
MQFDTQKHEVSQYLRSAHANRRVEGRVSRCMNTRHDVGQVDMEVSSGMAREHATGHVDAHVSPRMRPEACRTTHMRSGGSFLLAGVLYIYSAPLLNLIHPKHLKTWIRERERGKSRKIKQEIPSCYENFREFLRTEILPGSSERLSRSERKFFPSSDQSRPVHSTHRRWIFGFSITVPRRRFGGEKKGLVNIRNQRVEPHRLITPDRSRCHFVDPRLETMSRLSGYVYLVLVLLCENLVVVLVLVCRSLLPQMPPASTIEDRGTAIPIEDRDRAIPKHLHLCGVIVKGLLVSLMWRKNDSVGP